MRRATGYLLAATAFAAFSFTSVAAFAAGGGGSMPRTEVPRPEPSGPNKTKQVARETDYQKAEYLIKAEKYDEAIPLLKNVVADNPRDADAWNYLGFASRKLGNSKEAIGYYEKALKIDPNHKGAHNYLGEAYLQLNDVPKAEEQLTILKGICATNCEEAEDLAADIADYKTAHPAAPKSS